MNVPFPRLQKCAFAALCLALPACATIKEKVAKIPVPKMPDLSGVKRILPGGGEAPANDPEVPFNVGGRLTYGHTLRLRVYEGAMNAREIFSGTTMVDETGAAKIGAIGSAKIGGHTLPEAEQMIQSVCRISGRAGLQIHVHILSVESVDLVAVTGDVNAVHYLPMWSGMQFSAAVAQAGGRKPGSNGRAVYVTRNGVKKFFSHVGAADAWDAPEAGDIITLSADL